MQVVLSKGEDLTVYVPHVDGTVVVTVTESGELKATVEAPRANYPEGHRTRTEAGVRTNLQL